MNFSRHPGAAHDGVIDYATAEGRKFYESASKNLNGKDEDAFDCVPEGLASMLNRLKVRANNYGWLEEQDGVLSIPNEVGIANPEWINMIEEYGRIPLELVQEQDITYIATQTRKA